MGDRPYCAAHNNGGATFDVYIPNCPCNKPTPDPRDARITELEAALAGLVDALPRCDCSRRADSVEFYYDQTRYYCAEHAKFRSVGTPPWDDAADAAERVLRGEK